MYKINIITFSMSFLLSLGSKDINAQNSKDENLRFMSNKYYNLYESYMIGVLFDSAAATLIKSIEFSSKIQNKLSLDSMILLASYQKLCVINEYLGKYDEILKYFDKAFLYLDKRISPEDPTQFSELMLLKQIMVVQILCIKDIESDQFNNNFNRFTELVNLNRKNSKKYSNGKKYLDLFTKIKSGDKSENLYNILKCESLELQSHVFTDYQTLYRILKDLVETYDKVLLTCENNEKIIFQTYLHAHAGHLSYVALFNKNFILAEKWQLKHSNYFSSKNG
ncbi:MAG: hypothetical protein IPK25_03515 [Saprospiraceae bacterium]|nr:hypothetical protein [Saprospiraceae bacterium]